MFLISSMLFKRESKQTSGTNCTSDCTFCVIPQHNVHNRIWIDLAIMNKNQIKTGKDKSSELSMNLQMVRH